MNCDKFKTNKKVKLEMNLNNNVLIYCKHNPLNQTLKISIALQFYTTKLVNLIFSLSKRCILIT